MAAIVEFGFNAQAVERGLAGLENRISGFGARVQKSMPNLTGMLGVGAAGAAVKQTLTHYDDLADAALRLGESTEMIQKVEYASKQLASVDMNGLVASFLKLEKALGETGTEAEPALEALARLGITQRSLSAMTLDQKVLAMSTAFQQARADGTGYNDILDLLGKSAGNLIPMFTASRESIEELFGQAPVLADSAVQQMAALNDRVDGFVDRTRAGFGALISLGGSLASMMGGASFTEAFGTSDDQASAAAQRERDRESAAAGRERRTAEEAAAKEAEESAKAADAAAKEKEKTLARVKAIQDNILKIELQRLTPAERLVRLAEIQKQKIEEMRNQGGLFFEATVEGMQKFAEAQAAKGSNGVEQTLERLQEIMRLQQEMEGLQSGMRQSAVDTSEAAAEAAAAKEKEQAKEREKALEEAISAEKERQQKLEASRDLALEMAILQAKAKGQGDVAKQLEREQAIRQRMQSIMSRTGMGEDEARIAAARMQALQEQADAREEQDSGRTEQGRYDDEGRRADGRRQIRGYSRTRQGGAEEARGRALAGLAETWPGMYAGKGGGADNPLAGKAEANSASPTANNANSTQQVAQVVLQVLPQILEALK